MFPSVKLDKEHIKYNKTLTIKVPWYIQDKIKAVLDGNFEVFRMFSNLFCFRKMASRLSDNHLPFH